MTAFAFQRVRIEAMACVTPDRRVTSSELEGRLGAVYRRLNIPLGTLERISGVKARRQWPMDFAPSDGATQAVRKALAKSRFSHDQVGAIVNCSVSRDYFEPATACLVHNKLELPQSALAMDVSNACVGFSSGLIVLGHLIESGAIDVGVAVSCETASQIMESTVERLNQDENLDRSEFLKLLPALTLGGGAVAFILTRDDLAEASPRLLGYASRSATHLSDLCVGNGDHCFHSGGLDVIMRTDAAALMAGVGEIAGTVKSQLLHEVGWTKKEIDRVFIHQVGKVVDAALFEEVGLEESKSLRIYEEFGNQISAGLPFSLTLASEREVLKRGDRLLAMGFGSGLNAIATAIQW